jgi:predicted transcriptional regulator
MGVLQVPDEVLALIERQVAAGRADDGPEFLLAAVSRYVADLENEDEVTAAARAGLADVAAGRVIRIETEADGVAFWASVASRVSELVAAREQASEAVSAR